MAGYTASSSTLGVSNLVSVVNFTGSLGGTHANTCNVFIGYTKGDESSTVISVGFIKKALSITTVYKGAIPATATVAQQTYTISATGNWSLSFPVDGAADKIVLSVAGTGSSPTGTLAIDAYPVIE